jgi:hypothetical protein
MTLRVSPAKLAMFNRTNPSVTITPELLEDAGWTQYQIDAIPEPKQ